MEKIILKNGKEVNVREASKEDARQMIDFYNVVAGETDFLSFGENEFSKELTEYEEFIESTRKEENSIILLLEIDKKIVGIAPLTLALKLGLNMLVSLA